MEEVTELRGNVQKAVQRKMFPGYVMIHMIMNDDTWYVVRNTRGVTGFVGPGSKPVPLEDSEMENLGIKKDNVIGQLWRRRYGRCLKRRVGRHGRRRSEHERTEEEPVYQCRAVWP